VNANARPIIGPDGCYGSVDTTCWPNFDELPDLEVDVRLNDGSHVTVPSEVLIEQKDGSYYVPLSREEVGALPHTDKPMPGTDGCWPCEDKKHARELMHPRHPRA